jgi:hypothetical protein
MTPVGASLGNLEVLYLGRAADVSITRVLVSRALWLSMNKIVLLMILGQAQGCIADIPLVDAFFLPG